MATLHLWFQEPPELPFDGPPDPIPLLMPALYYVLTVREDVSVGPYTLVNDKFRNRLCLLVLLCLSALNGAPESLRTAMRMFAKGTGSHS